VGIFERSRELGRNFTDALISAYVAVLCSPGFLYLDDEPGAARRSRPRHPARLLPLELAAPTPNSAAWPSKAACASPETLRAQADRLLDDPRSRRFVDAFLDGWLDLKEIDANTPDAELYPDYYLDDYLKESSLAETQLFVSELIRRDLPARNIVGSDFTFLNEHLARHYKLPPVEGVALRRVDLPEGTPRGGLLTQASVLKVTANGTTTSPVLRGSGWLDRILGEPPPPPPPAVPAIDPDIRGAKTIREQLEKHRANTACASCHARIDPPGFALESFDVFGGWRERYRGIDEAKAPVEGVGKNGHLFTFHEAMPVDPGAVLPDGSSFADVGEFKRLLSADERRIARNLAGQLVVYATGAPVRFGDRAEVDAILDRAARVRSASAR
jgi:hypothetical protein